MLADIVEVNSSKGDAILVLKSRKWQERRVSYDRSTEVVLKLREKYREIGIELPYDDLPARAFPRLDYVWPDGGQSEESHSPVTAPKARAKRKR